MVHNSTANTFMVRNMELVNSLGVMGQLTLGCSMKTKLKDKVSTAGRMEDSLMVFGSTIKWKDTEYSTGQTVGDMKVNTSMIRKRGMVFSSGLMEENMMEHG